MATILELTSKLPPKKAVLWGNGNQIIKNNRWVLYQGTLGIVTDMNENGTCNFNAVDDDGFTYSVIPDADYTKMELAHWAQIPEQRRPSKEVCETLGYPVN